MVETKSYSELLKIKTFDERLKYLKTNSLVGHDTFGYDRYLNQIFYNSYEWKKTRNYIITRDNGCDLGCIDHEILYDKVIIHHINPITKHDIINKTRRLLDPENLITVSYKTHEAIHYGNDLKTDKLVERSKNDTCPWKNIK